VSSAPHVVGRFFLSGPTTLQVVLSYETKHRLAQLSQSVTWAVACYDIEYVYENEYTISAQASAYSEEGNAILGWPKVE
jgi:hypothetical protein